MNMLTKSLPYLTRAALLSNVFLCAPAFSSMLNLSDTPLFIESSVPPNILFVMDDSGSMDWETTLNKGTHDPGGVSRGTLDFTPEYSSRVLDLCPGYNTLAYNPSRVYTPWRGFDTNGAAYQSISNGLIGTSGLNNTPMWNPWWGADSQNIRNLSQHIYFEWSDNDRDNAYDEGECPTTAPTRSNGNFSYSRCDNIAGCVKVANLSTSQQQNYANWYTYYRKRAYIAQRATSELVYNSGARMGLGTLHNNSSVGTPISDMTVNANKRNLLDKVSQLYSSGGTPLRTALARAGNYYQTGNGRLFSSSSDNIGSPILPLDEGGACQQNFSVVFSDGYMNGSYSGVGNADADGDGVFDGGAYADSLSNRLADIAMHYYETDLSPLANSVRETELVNNLDATDGNMHQHLITYTVAFGVAGNLTCNPLLSSCNESWPTEINNDDRRSVDDMWHAAVNGRGQFLSAFDPAGLIENLEAAISDIEARTSSSASLAANSTTLNAETVVYQATFNTGDWHGNLSALPVSVGTGDPRAICAGIRAGNVCLGTEDNPGTLWQTKDVINTQHHDTGRSVVTFKPSTGGAVAFRWPQDSTSPSASEIDNVLMNTLLRDGPTDSTQHNTYGQNIINYFRGDRSNEVMDNGIAPTATAVFRRRENSVLGDIINSAPKLVGPPSANYTDESYQTFKTTYANRDETIYIGANDGMLHAVDTDNGEVIYSYIPAESVRHLPNLAQPNYQHRYYVDGSPTVGDAYINGQWRTILLGSHRAGGQGIFALDITDPSKFTEEQADIDDVFLWEFERDELGYTFSRPDIVKLSDEKWYAVFGNGYNATENDGDPSPSGNARLYVVDLENGQAKELVVSDSSDSVSNPNGLSTATPVDEDGDKITDFVYAGDLKGNLWRFDVRDASSVNWSSTKVFTTLSPEGTRQPITVRPSVAFHPDEGRSGFLVFFGTGRYIDEADGSSVDQDTQSFYAVWDDPLNPTPSSQVPPAFNRISGYLQQTINQEVAAFGNQIRITSDNPINWDIHHGWYMDLVNTQNGNTSNGGERVVAQSTLRGDRIVFVSILPDEIACNFGGKSVLMELNFEDGRPLAEAPFDINNDGVINSDDLVSVGNAQYIGSGMVLDGINTDPIYLNGSAAGTEHKMMSSSAQAVNSVLESQSGLPPSRRSSWRELSID